MFFYFCYRFSVNKVLCVRSQKYKNLEIMKLAKVEISNHFCSDNNHIINLQGTPYRLRLPADGYEWLKIQVMDVVRSIHESQHERFLRSDHK